MSTDDNDAVVFEGDGVERIAPSGPYYYRSDADSRLKYSSNGEDFDFRKVFAR